LTLAVLNNIITRGLPTKASPFIENNFTFFGNALQQNDSGSIIYENKNIDAANLQLAQSPIAIARLQKIIIEALLTEQLEIDKAEWNVLVIENDVPCGALAFADLADMFNNLTSLSIDYDKIKFPNVHLEIISSEKYINSPLHLDNKPHTTATTNQRSKEYDLVVDISMAEFDNKQKFSAFKSKNKCYFNIRSAKSIKSDRHIYTSDIIEYKPLVKKDTQGNYKDIETNKQHLQYFAQLLFRKEDFRHGQLPILNRALQNKSVIGLLPTGGGKSLTYQLAAMLQPGVTLIIDPLRSLMKDQYDGLIDVGIDTCTFINSTLSAQQKTEQERLMETSQMQFVFLSPERLCIYKFRERLKTMRDMNVYFAYGVIDEVHCVSEWGHDFRFSYLHLGRNLYNYVLPKNRDKRLTLFGLTATASFDVLADVERELSGNGAFALDTDTIVRYENTNRLELQYKIEKVPVEYEPDKYFDQKGLLDPSLGKAVNISDKWAVYNSKRDFLKTYITQVADYANELQTDSAIKRIKAQFNERQNTQENNNEINLNIDFPFDFYKVNNEYKQAGIVFCPHKNTTGISVNENAISLKEHSSQVGTFMGSGDSEDADEIDKVSFENLELFRDNKLPLMVATKAFGMGIDKPNVRFTVNMNYSSSLESFVQEAGRAGRDKKVALATILFADYKLVRLSSKFQSNQFPLGIIKNKWFKEADLLRILNHYNLTADNEYFDYFTPQHDLVKLRCEVDNKKFAFGECNTCPQINYCNLSKVPKEAKGFQYFKDLEEKLKNNGLDFQRKNLEYVSADYETVMFFYNNNFKGSLIEKQTMHSILSKSEAKYFLEDNEEIKANEIETVTNFLQKLLSVEAGTEIVAFISYAGNYADFAKAIYRMCCIELIDDFTQDYSLQQFRIVTKRKADGDYYKGLEKFLMRYYSTERAEEEIEKVKQYKGENEIHKCLSYLTEFIYEKIAVKRKRAIDDMRTFCIQGINETKDWKEVNEDLKDFIYYYFNSKYAQDDYETEKGEPFSLTTDSDKGKISSFDILFKFLRVIKEDVYGSSGSPKDSVKHLQGAVRLIRRSLTDDNPALAMLNAFCLAYLGTNNNEVLEQELEMSYKEGYLDFYSSISDKDSFYTGIEKLNSIFKKSHLQKTTITKMHDWSIECELEIHNNWLNNFTEKYATLK
jgi:superfamily II DNA helicase RecQ